MTDEDIQHLCNPSNNYGTFTTSPWTGSAIKKKQKGEKVEDNSIDYIPETEDIESPNNINIEDDFSEELPEEDDYQLD